MNWVSSHTRVTSELFVSKGPDMRWWTELVDEERFLIFHQSFVLLLRLELSLFSPPLEVQEAGGRSGLGLA